MRKSKKETKVSEPKVKQEETAIDKLGSELKETQNGSKTIVSPVTSLISNPELYFSFMEIAALDLFARRKNVEALKILNTIFTQYQEYKSKAGNYEDEIDLIFADSHQKKEEKDNGKN